MIDFKYHFFYFLQYFIIVSLDELVRDKETGFVFKNEDELAEQLLDWFHDFPNNTKTLKIKQTIDTNLKKFQELRWQENWNKIAWPVIQT